jgi:hypothetical protein
MMTMEVQEQFFEIQISALHPKIGYGDGQFTAFASDLGIVAGEVPTVINLHSPKSGRTIQFVLERHITNRGDRFFYKPSPVTPARFSHLSVLVFND